MSTEERIKQKSKCSVLVETAFNIYKLLLEKSVVTLKRSTEQKNFKRIKQKSKCSVLYRMIVLREKSMKLLQNFKVIRDEGKRGGAWKKNSLTVT